MTYRTENDQIDFVPFVITTDVRVAGFGGETVLFSKLPVGGAPVALPPRFRPGIIQPQPPPRNVRARENLRHRPDTYCLFFAAAWFPVGPAELVAFYRTPNLRAFAPNRFSIVRARAPNSIGKTSDSTGIPRETFPGKKNAIFVTTVFYAFIYQNGRRSLPPAGTRLIRGVPSNSSRPARKRRA